MIEITNFSVKILDIIILSIGCEARGAKGVKKLYPNSQLFFLRP